MTRAERYAQIKPLRDEGLTYREIGERLGISARTAHDVVADPTGERARARKAKNNGTCIDCGAETKNGGGGVPPERCARCNVTHTRALPLRREASLNRRGKSRWTDEQILDELRAASYAGLLTTTIYDAAHAADPSLPSRSLVVRRFDRWNEAVRRAGLRSRGPGRNTRPRTPNADMLAAIRDHEAELGRLPSRDEYQAWARANGRASAALIRQRFGAWMVAIEQLVAEEESNPSPVPGATP